MKLLTILKIWVLESSEQWIYIANCTICCHSKINKQTDFVITPAAHWWDCHYHSQKLIFSDGLWLVNVITFLSQHLPNTGLPLYVLDVRIPMYIPSVKVPTYVFQCIYPKVRVSNYVPTYGYQSTTLKTSLLPEIPHKTLLSLIPGRWLLTNYHRCCILLSDHTIYSNTKYQLNINFVREFHLFVVFCFCLLRQNVFNDLYHV